MATVHVSIGPVGSLGLKGPVAAYHGSAMESETITSSGSSAAGSLTAANDTCVAQVYCDSAIYAASGISPTAAAANSVYVPAGAVVYIALKAGESVAVVDV